MKKRIIGLALVVAILALTLTGCAYRYEGDDMSKYASFDKAKFEEAIKTLKIEDGDFTKDEAVRAKKLNDAILNLLSAKLDSSSTKIKETTGTVGDTDIVYYCYYYTAEIDGVTRYFSTSLMAPEKAVKLHIGLSANEGQSVKVEQLLKGEALDDKVYEATTSKTLAKVDGKVTEADSTVGKLAFISYTVEYDGADGKSVKETHEYELVTLGEGSFIAKALADKDIGKAQDKITEGSGATAKTYTNATVNILVEGGEEYTYTEVTYTTVKSVKDNITESGTDKTYDLKDKELTYHVYPVYRVAIPEFNANTLLDTLYSNLTSAELECLEDQEEALEELEKLVADETTAKTDYDKKKTAYETAKTNYDTAVKNLADGKVGATQELVDQKKKDCDAAKADFDKAEKSYNDAKAAVTAKRTDIITKVGADKLVTEFKKVQYKGLLDAYNKEIKDNLAKAIYKAVTDNSKITVEKEQLPQKAIQQVYDNMINQYKYEFYEGDYTSASGSTAAVSNYEHYKTFENYLTKKKTTANFTDAKHAVWAEAAETVKELIIIYNAAQAYDVALTGKDLDDFKADTESDRYYNYWLYSQLYGYSQDSLDEAVRNAVQFDKLMNHFLTYEEVENENGGVEFKYNYKGLGYEITEAEDD